MKDQLDKFFVSLNKSKELVLSALNSSRVQDLDNRKFGIRGFLIDHTDVGPHELSRTFSFSIPGWSVAEQLSVKLNKDNILWIPDMSKLMRRNLPDKNNQENDANISTPVDKKIPTAKKSVPPRTPLTVIEINSTDDTSENTSTPVIVKMRNKLATKEVCSSTLSCISTSMSEPKIIATENNDSFSSFLSDTVCFSPSENLVNNDVCSNEKKKCMNNAETPALSDKAAAQNIGDNLKCARINQEGCNGNDDKSSGFLPHNIFEPNLNSKVENYNVDDSDSEGEKSSVANSEVDVESLDNELEKKINNNKKKREKDQKSAKKLKNSSQLILYKYSNMDTSRPMKFKDLVKFAQQVVCQHFLSSVLLDHAILNYYNFHPLERDTMDWTVVFKELRDEVFNKMKKVKDSDITSRLTKEQDDHNRNLGKRLDRIVKGIKERVVKVWNDLYKGTTSKNQPIAEEPPENVEFSAFVTTCIAKTSDTCIAQLEKRIVDRSSEGEKGDNALTPKSDVKKKKSADILGNIISSEPSLKRLKMTEEPLSPASNAIPQSVNTEFVQSPRQLGFNLSKETANVSPENGLEDDIISKFWTKQIKDNVEGSVESNQLVVSFRWGMKEFTLALCDANYNCDFLSLLPTTERLWERALNNAKHYLKDIRKSNDAEWLNNLTGSGVEMDLIKGVFLPLLVATLGEKSVLSASCYYEKSKRFQFKITKPLTPGEDYPYDVLIAPCVFSWFQFDKRRLVG